MLSSGQRLCRPADFADTTKNGRRQKAGALVVYLCTAGSGAAAPRAPSPSPRAGLIVGKTVGNSVVRHRVSRRIREQLRPQLQLLVSDDRVVVRALPGASLSSSAEISHDLSTAINRLTRTRRDRS
jgi:ribonuclease P protein component